MFKHSFVATVTFAFCFYLSSCKNDKNSIINSMIKYGTYEGMYYGKTTKISPQWKNYEALTNKFSENELIELCDHTNPIVRCYAFKALAYSHSAKTYNVLLKHLSDTSEFDRSYGDIDDYDRVTDNILDEVCYEKRVPTKYNLTEQQYKTIDSLLLLAKRLNKDQCSLPLSLGQEDIYWKEPNRYHSFIQELEKLLRTAFMKLYHCLLNIKI